MIIVSACLVGFNCRYDQKAYSHPLLEQELKQGSLLPVCPEQLGGLPTPRIPSEICGGTARTLLLEQDRPLEEKTIQVVNRAGKNVTEQFLRGAREVARLAQVYGAKAAILKARSPSCGFGQIYDGSFTHRLVAGSGVTAELLHQQGVRVVTEEEISPELLAELKML